MTRRYTLPWPPSVNASIRGGHYLSKATRDFREVVQGVVWCAKYGEPFYGRLEVRIIVVPPDKRKRDLDNLIKAPLDAMQLAGAFVDDSQIDILHVERVASEKTGKLLVEVNELK